MIPLPAGMTAVATTDTRIENLVIGAESATRATEAGHHIGILVAQSQLGMATRARLDVMRHRAGHKVIVVSITILLVHTNATRTIDMAATT